MRDAVREALQPAMELPSEQTGSWDNGYSLRSVLVAVRQRWYLVLPVFALVVVVGVWRAWREPRRYRAATTVRMQQQDQMSVTNAYGRPSYDPRIDRMITEQQVIRSSIVAERAAVDVGLRLRVVQPERVFRSQLFGSARIVVDTAAPTGEYRVHFEPTTYSLVSGGTTEGTAPYGTPLSARGVTMTVPRRPAIKARDAVLEVVPLELAADEVRYALGTRAVEKTDIIEIAYTSTDPVYAANVANAVARAYASFSKQEIAQNARTRSEFIAGQLRAQEQRLAAAQDSLRIFRQTHESADVGQDAIALAERIQLYENQRREALLEQEIYEQLIERAQDSGTDDALRRLLGTEAPQRNPTIVDLYNRWSDLATKRQELVLGGEPGAQLQESAPRVAALDSSILQTKRDLAMASRVYVQSLQSRIRSLEGSLQKLRAETKKYPPWVADQARLLADERTQQNMYEQLQRELLQSKIAESSERDLVRIIDQAAVPQWPVSPSRRRALMLSVALGLLLGIGLAVLLDRLDDSVKTPDEIREQLGVTLLGSIPRIKAEKPVPGVQTNAAERLVTHADPRSPVAEAYRSLRTNLAFARAQEELRTVVLTSPGPADGKSTSVANLATTFAQQGQRTLLVDADLRRAVLDKTFDVPRSPGLTEVIVGAVPLENAVHDTPIPNLFVLSSGQFPPNPSELLGSPAMREVLRAAKDQFDVILFDSPPLLAVTDAAVLSTMVDGTILVVRLGSTAREAVRRAISDLRRVHGRVLGVLMNDVSAKAGAYYGGYGYYYYYRYAYYGSEGGNGNGNGNGGVMGRLRRMVGGGRPDAPARSGSRRGGGDAES
ncbi:MAG TPA: polysaccharide biosynthesis tyrosine autokinase [Gemmatimonadaceae bacterium]|nr:polysaccharide biosynthesis tyrosine autokinase [Gemmatimonadaceae bacterium]